MGLEKLTQEPRAQCPTAQAFKTLNSPQKYHFRWQKSPDLVSSANSGW